MNNQKNLIVIGTITGISGIKGYVRFKFFTISPHDIMHFAKILDEYGDECKVIRIVSVKKNIAVLQIDNINSMDIARKLIGRKLMVFREALPDVESNEFYHVDLIGMDVYLSSDDKIIGTVMDVVNYGASDILEVQSSTSNNIITYPFIKDFIKEVNTAENYIVVEPMEII